MFRRTNPLVFILFLAIVVFALAGWAAVSFGELHDRLAKHSSLLAVSLTTASIVVALGAAVAAARLAWKTGRVTSKIPRKAPEDVVKAAEAQAQSAAELIDQVRDQTAKKQLNVELSELKAQRQSRRFQVVIFGTGSSGKTSLVNALLGGDYGKTEAVMGTTRRGERHDYELEGVDGTLVVTDTPGLFEAGRGGAELEAEARDLAARADLLIFLLDHDLTRSEFEPVEALVKQGKRSIVALNKKDRLVDQDKDAILAKLRERLSGFVHPRDVVAIAAKPRAMPIRIHDQNGLEQTILEPQPPDVDPLLDRISAILSREGESLRAGNLLLRAHMLTKSAQEAIARQRYAQAQDVVDRFQWITAGAVFVNPLPVLDLLATGAVQFQMIAEIAAVHGVDLAPSHAKMIAGQMIQTLLKLGIVETAASLIAGVFKSTIVGHAAGGAVQAVTMSYLTHVSGQTFIDYFQRGQDWGDGGLQAALTRQFDLNSRAEFLKEFAAQALKRLTKKAVGLHTTEAK